MSLLSVEDFFALHHTSQVILLFICLHREKSGNMWNRSYKERPGICCNKILFILHVFQPCIIGRSLQLELASGYIHRNVFHMEYVSFSMTEMALSLLLYQIIRPSWLKFSPFTRQIAMLRRNGSNAPVPPLSL